jgi:predicted transcriptional regulator
MESKPPIKRQDPFTGSGAQDIDRELEAQLGARERRKAKARKAKRPKATYDLSLALIKKIQEVASREDVSQSDIVAWALVEFLERYEAGGANLQEHKTAARSLRFACKLELPEGWR